MVPAWRLCSIQTGRVRCYGENGSLGLGVGTLFEDRKGNLWAGTGTGLWRWKPGAPQAISLSGPASEIHALVEGDNGALLVATRGGILHLVDGKAAAYPLPGTGPHFNPFRLLQDRDGGLWIGPGPDYCMFTREKQISSPSLTVSHSDSIKICSRIVKAMCGYAPIMASIAFATSP